MTGKFGGGKEKSFGWMTQRQVSKEVKRSSLAGGWLWKQEGERFSVVTKEAMNKRSRGSRLADEEI